VGFPVPPCHADTQDLRAHAFSDLQNEGTLDPFTLTHNPWEADQATGTS